MTSSSIAAVFDCHEIAAMVKASPCLWWQAFIELSVDTGLRVNEILRLHGSDIDERTQCVRITSDPIEAIEDAERVSLRCWMPPHRERIVPVSDGVMRKVAGFRSEHPSYSYVFVPDWKLDQLWTRIVAQERLTSEQICPRMNSWFQMLQRRGRLLLAKDRGKPVSRVAWHRRGVGALRTTAIHRLAARLQPPELAERLGYPTARSVLHFCPPTRPLQGGRRE